MNPPSKFGRFEVIGELGKGAMGVVYKAKDPLIDREVAIKTLSAEGREDPELHERFTREARSAGILHHPNIITVYDVGEQDGIPFLALEYLEGRTLQEVIDSDEELTLTDKVRMLEQVASGLNYAHERGVIHRDVKPENVMILDDGTAKITDFGIARSESTDKTKPGVVLGSVGYMAPEQIKGLTLDRRADVFSLGILAYETLTGRRAFPGDNIPSVMSQILNVDPPAPSKAVDDLPEAADAIIAKALAKDRDERYESAQEFVEDLSSTLGAVAEAAPPADEAQEEEIRIEEIFGEAEFEEPEEPTQARPVNVVSILLILLVVLGGGALLFFGYMKYNDIKERAFREELSVDLEDALTYINAGRYEEAITKCDDILLKDPHNGEATAMRAQAEGRLLRKRQNPALHDQAAAAVTAGNLQAAIEIYQRILQNDPRDADAKLRIVELEQKIRNRNKVADILARANEAFEHGRYREAQALWEEVFRVDPGNAEAREGIEQVESRLTGLPELDQMAEEAEEHYRTGEYTLALALWEKILQVQPENESLRERVKKTRAMAAYAEQLDAWRRRAQNHFEQGDYEEAIKAWRRILEYKPFDAEAQEGIQRAKEALRE